MSNGVFSFNFLALLLSEIFGGLKFTLGGPTPPMSNSVFNFNILARVVSEILGGPNLR